MLALERSRGGETEMDSFDGLDIKTITGDWFSGFGRKAGAELVSRPRRRACATTAKLVLRQSEVVKKTYSFDGYIKR